MFPNFPNLAEAIAAERAADFQRDGAAFRQARRFRRASVAADRAGLRPHSVRRVPAGVGGAGTCAAARTI